MSNNNSNVPAGLIQPTMSSFTPGAGNPRESALLAQQQMNQKQQSLNSSVGGKRKYKGGSSVAVPQFQMQYTPTGGPGSNPNDQIKSTSSTSMQSTAWAADDNLATKKGGKKYRKKTKKHYKKNTRKTRKSRHRRSYRR